MRNFVSNRARNLARATGLALLLMAAIVLVGCRPPEVIAPPEDSIPVQATTDPAEAVRTVTIPANDEVVFDLIVPAGSAGSYDVFYVEIDANLPLELRRSSNYGLLVASSSGPGFFASGSGALSTSSAEAEESAAAGAGQAAIEPEAIGVSRVCGGSCVIRPIGDNLHARVRNTSGTSREVTLYFFVDVFQDEFEPENDSRPGAPPLGADDQGAIELIGDTDFWLAPSRREVLLTQAAGALPVRAVVVNHNGVAVSELYSSGDSFEVCEGFYVRVAAAVSNRAAAPGTSLYTLSSTPLAPDPDCGAPQTVSITANLNPGAPRHSASLPPGGALFLDMSVPPIVRNMPAVYFELSADLRLELRNAANTSVLASSSSSEFFAEGDAGLLREGAEEPAVRAEGISTTVSCRGSCVIFEAGAGAYVGLIVNEGSTTVPFDVYLYGDDLVDQGENANDSIGTAPQLQSPDAGAIETIGDVDHFRVPSSVSVSFDPGPGIALQLEVVNASGVTQIGPISGGNVLVLGGEYLRVRAQDSSMAAASARSSYYLSAGAAVSDAEVIAQRTAPASPR